MLKKLFNKAAIVLLAGTFALVPGLSCAHLDADQGPVPERDKVTDTRLSRLFDRAAGAGVGKDLTDRLTRNGVTVTFNENLNKPNSRGFVTLGRYLMDDDKIELNPSEERSDTLMALVLVHEARHHHQDNGAVNWDTDRNVPEHERIALHWFTEADSRLSEIVFSHEMKDRHPEYMAILRNDNGYKKMIEAFEASLAAKPDDIRAAMRAAIRAFPEMTSLAGNYAHNTQDWIESKGRRFKTDRQAATILGTQNLTRFSNYEGYGNYMTPELAVFIRASFTVADHRKLLQDRAPKPAPADTASAPAPGPTS